MSHVSETQSRMQSDQYSDLCGEKGCTVQIQNQKHLHCNIAINDLTRGKFQGEQTYDWRDLDRGGEQEPNDSLRSSYKTECWLESPASETKQPHLIPKQSPHTN